MVELAPRARKWLIIALLTTASIGAALGVWWSGSGPSRLLEHGRNAYSRGQWDEAEAAARRRLKADPHDVEALRLFARSTARLGNDRAANAVFARMGSAALEAEDLFLLGLGLNRTGQKDAARRVWLKADALNPAFPETLEQLVISSTALNRLTEAAKYAERLSHQPGWELRGDLDLGALLSELNQPGDAAAVLSRALKRPEARSLDQAAQARYRKLLVRKLLELGRSSDAAPWLGDEIARGPDPEASWLESRVALQQGRLAEATAALKAAGAYRKDHPLEAEPSPFVGEARCTPCHSSIARQSQSSRHTTTLIRGDALAQIPYPDHPIPDPDNPNVSHSFHRQNGQIRFETRQRDQVHSAIVAYAFGSLDRYVSLVGPDQNGHEYILRLSHFHTAKDAGWVRTTGHTANAGGGDEILGKALDSVEGVERCLFCHSTNPRAVMDQAKVDRPRTRDQVGQAFEPDIPREGPTAKTTKSPSLVSPEADDRAIGCERCHGPGGNHLLAVAAKLPDLAIANAAEATAEGRVRVCGQCHSYHQELSLPRIDSFWIRFQGTALAWSRCYTESGGNFDCMTCHDAHDDSDRSEAHYNERCLNCHAPDRADSSSAAAKGGSRKTPRSLATEPSQTARGSTCPVNTSSGCVGCHMPAFYSKPIHATFTDHYIRVRPETVRPLPTKGEGR
jgi:tetratricopeptide (TPR) repeat protein